MRDRGIEGRCDGLVGMGAGRFQRGVRCAMRILLTNDDGIRAPGIVALFDALSNASGIGSWEGPVRVAGSPVREIFPIAPLTVQSATGHGITFHEPLMTQAAKVPLAGIGHMSGIAVDGRPADCVKLAISQLWPERFGAGSRPDLLISGMNAGANCGINVIYSGTVAAALEGAFLGVPSIAVSLHIGRGKTRFDIAAARARRVIELLLASGLPETHACVSVNIPVTEDGDAGLDQMPPVRVCPMNTHGLVDQYERRVNPLGEVYYWASGHGLDFHGTEAGTDVDLLMRKSVTVTPLFYDLTAHAQIAKWRAVVGDRHAGA